MLQYKYMVNQYVTEELIKRIQLENPEVNRAHLIRFFTGLFKAGGTNEPEDYKYAGGDGRLRYRNYNSNGGHYDGYYDKFFPPMMVESIAKDLLGQNRFHFKYWQEKVPELYPYFVTPKFKRSCVCTHPIQENCFVINTVTKTSIVIGNCCIKLYMPDEYIRHCFICNQPRQYMHNDYICKDCRPQYNKDKKAQKKAEEQREKAEREQMAREEEATRRLARKEKEQKERTLRHLGNYKVYFGQYQGMKFKELLEKLPSYCDWILEEDEKKGFRCKSIVNYLKLYKHLYC